MFDRDDFDGVCADPIDEDVIGRDDRFACVRDAPGTMHIGMIDQSLGRLCEQIGVAEGGGRIAVGEIGDDFAHVFPRFRAPDDLRHQARLAFLPSMMACSSAIT